MLFEYLLAINYFDVYLESGIYLFISLMEFVGWDEGVLDMQLGEVARLRVKYLLLFHSPNDTHS